MAAKKSKARLKAEKLLSAGKRSSKPVPAHKVEQAARDLRKFLYPHATD